MKLGRLFLCIILLLCIVSFQVSGENLTRQMLTSSQWGPDRSFGVYMTFFQDGRYEYVYKTLTVEGWQGEYSLDDGVLSIYGSLKNGILHHDPDALPYTDYIEFENSVKIYRYDSEVPSGTKMLVSSSAAITMGRQQAKVIENLKIRETPSTKAKYYKFSVKMGSEDKIREFNYIPKGGYVTVLARTPKKVSVGSWKNYWYYIIPDPIGACNNIARGWVFGEFLEFE